jgi:hypothetical protein
MLFKKHQRCQESFLITFKNRKKGMPVPKFEYSNEKETKKNYRKRAHIGQAPTLRSELKIQNQFSKTDKCFCIFRKDIQEKFLNFQKNVIFSCAKLLYSRNF